MIDPISRRYERVKRYGEIKITDGVEHDGWAMVEGLLGLLLCVGLMLLILFLMGGGL